MHSKFWGHLKLKDVLLSIYDRLTFINQKVDARYNLKLMIDFFYSSRFRTTFKVKPKLNLNKISYNLGQSITLHLKCTKFFEKLLSFVLSLNICLTLKTPYRCGSDIWVVARLCCRAQYDVKRIVIASIRVALWQRYTYHKTRYRYQSDTYRYNRVTMYKDLNSNN